MITETTIRQAAERLIGEATLHRVEYGSEDHPNLNDDILLVGPAAMAGLDLVAENKRLREALQMAGIRLGILVGRMQACHEETGKHELLDEAVMFWTEARDATEAF